MQDCTGRSAPRSVDGSKALKILAILFVAYVAIVAAFESAIGYFQPAGGSTLVITTFDDDGSWHNQVRCRASRAAARSTSRPTPGPAPGTTARWRTRRCRRRSMNRKGDYLGVPVTGEEHERVASENALPLPFRILTGFPPSILRPAGSALAGTIAQGDCIMLRICTHVLASFLLPLALACAEGRERALLQQQGHARCGGHHRVHADRSDRGRDHVVDRFRWRRPGSGRLPHRDGCGRSPQRTDVRRGLPARRSARRVESWR